jgi:hypothetical protein
VSLTKAEIAANFDAFTMSWKADLPNAIAALDGHRDEFLKSYGRIASMNAWRSNVLEGRISKPSLEFFAEALNDGLVSHVFAHFGSWRSALMSLRSCIENTYYCLFYKDHPVELRLWQSGRHRPGFSEIHAYLEHHPDISSLGCTPVTGLALIKDEYGTLSRAVHASAKSFRMSPNVHDVALWKPDVVSLGQWRTREQHTLGGLNLLLISIFHDELSGAQQQGLRKALAIVVPASMHTRVKRELKVTIPSV